MDPIKIALIAFLIILAAASIPFAFIISVDYKIWHPVMKHLDEFAFDHTTKDGDHSYFNLYDKNGEILLEAMVDHRDKDVCIFKKSEIVASSFNTFFSKKAYKILFEKIPPRYRPQKPINKNELAKYLNDM